MDKKVQPTRRSNGTFAKGSSGNRKGRPKKDRRIPNPEMFRDMQYDVAEFELPITLKGKRFNINLVQANLMTLALAGANGDKASAKSYLDYLQQCTAQELRVMERNMKRLDPVEPAYLAERNPERRARLEEAWQRAMAEATGERERTTGGLGKKRPKRWPENN